MSGTVRAVPGPSRTVQEGAAATSAAWCLTILLGAGGAVGLLTPTNSGAAGTRAIVSASAAPESAAATAPAAASAPATATAPSAASAATAPSASPATIPAGVTNPQRAWQNWTLNCQGCHRPDGTGSEGTAPSLAGTVSKFLNVPGGREYLGRVPGVATSPFSNADLAELMNWMFWRFDKEHLPADFVPFTADELGRLRTQPLRLEASRMREDLLAKANAAADSTGP